MIWIVVALAEQGSYREGWGNEELDAKRRTLPGLDMPRILLKERGAFRNADTGGAWLSSARVVSIRRDWSFPHSPPLDPDLSDVEEDDEYYIYPQKSATKNIDAMVALGGSTTLAPTVYTNGDDDGGSGYSCDHYGSGWNDGEENYVKYGSDNGGSNYGSGENNSVNESVNGVNSTLTGEHSDGGYEYADGGNGGGDDGYASNDGGEEGGGDGNYSGDGGSSYGGGGYKSA
ncbi:hypothetical protein RND71_024295 [Anisodus tanguticus]|uniref:Uncharacterized protein n=1 Tax=Anisodus tanguticus TaxID=243964 RepID=A0AAE1RQE4_9SOLA|nr:hypothetical protein RND71_024295 [Anisodus tanguticus]